jgi:hypothetical protein
VNRREAKRLACQEGAAVLQAHIESGWRYDEGLSDKDAERFLDGLEELIDELKERGAHAPTVRDDTPPWGVETLPMAPPVRIG